MDQEKQNQPKTSSRESKAAVPGGVGLHDILRRLKSEMGPLKPGQEKIEAALDAANKLALQMDSDVSAALVAEAQERRTCHSCGNPNPRENRFCARCGVPLHDLPEGDAPAPGPVKLINPLTPAGGQHHYHHHYHHHYFSSSAEVAPFSSPEQRVVTPSLPREASKLRPAAGTGLSRAEAALRKLALDWALACNTKHLDDLVELYTADAIVLRPNVAPVRSTAAIREFFCSVLEAGLGEVELEPLRVEVFGEMAYEVGRCSMLAPTTMGKRREERGKYVLLAARQAGEWKIIVDCWSTDLTLAVPAETSRPAGVPAPAFRGSPKTT